SPSVYSIKAVLVAALSSLALNATANEQYPEKEIPGCKGLAWELLSKDCETYLPDIHYSDAIQNRQIADLRLKDPSGKRYYQIDRLIYPTIGAPNLFFQGLTEGKGANVDDEFVMMLSLPDSDYMNLLEDAGKGMSTKNARKLPFKPQTLDKGSESGIFVYLSERSESQRSKLFSKKTFGGNSKAGSFYAVQPLGIWRYARPDEMPPALAERAKLKLIFGQEEMKDVPPGFYDVRIEIMDNGKMLASEFQYNAVRVFDKDFDQTNYEVLNVTDSQASVGVIPLLLGKSFRQQTLERLAQMSSHMKKLFASGQARNAAEEKVLKTAFITFNGDLHNGGDPLMLKPEDVAKNYNEEAIAILDVIKDLPIPFFLTAGNHDGYVSMGHAPGFIRKGQERIAKIAQENVANGAISKATAAEFSKFIGETKDLPGGNHVDIFDGHFVRRANEQRYDKAWTEPTPGTKRNLPLYDGFNQWKKTYGPLTQSWAFGNTTYININSFDLRQHMRS
ncbi:MAG: metallophosphoesterase, partial [Bdellovibrionales bacterium]|nr:metallophosphoesterase [Bdellovibrionales bacterium]